MHISAIRHTRLAWPGRVQEFSGSLDTSRPSITLPLYDFDPGDTLSVNVEATSGDLTPVLVLRDFGGKPVSVNNLQGNNPQTSLEYSFPEGGQGYTLEIHSSPQGQPPTSGEFRLLAGVNNSEVQSGAAEPNSEDVLRLAGYLEGEYNLK